ncbi:hypothetical protein P7K49_025194 [Saguinus oedipus]|uniref:Uncharacterized protein n=1 Tax=Saguinus oedipus TaxID=9490 RepID=A0ABQ9UHA5_SAGOE|nr:hypothetical protein P7K49_025194 [Saguinus oedipus]
MKAELAVTAEKRAAGKADSNARPRARTPRRVRAMQGLCGGTEMCGKKEGCCGQSRDCKADGRNCGKPEGKRDVFPEREAGLCQRKGALEMSHTAAKRPPHCRAAH